MRNFQQRESGQGQRGHERKYFHHACSPCSSCIMLIRPILATGDRGPRCKQGRLWFSPNNIRITSTSRDETPGPVRSTSLSYL
ncbi:hypothetical protein CORC01_14245 [Colletotrichum orchidophilum]|uniref:Uncharacterized protein n=1 Tax=Colletotrichum orchidophilum TaxID=1209926 RepID=A0A1G4AN58_9PEZI|nr:uncharacterized protein CORC01_14245 [Colletotrichum orchidophilum]OHE90462.1 hypothetical protein CORC01_14245 [Colletotrichum orchidophilum]